MNTNVSIYLEIIRVKRNPTGIIEEWFLVPLLIHIERHLESYPTPRNINFFWNLGFLVALTMILQILTGILLGLHYTPHINSAYTTIMHILREVYFGWSFRSLHSSGASFLFFLLFFHLGRALYYGSSRLIPKVWFSGIFLFIFLMATAFLGYVLPWGQMSFWGATVITNLFSGVPCLVPWVCGGFLVSNPSLSRFFVFHFLLPFLIVGFFSLHLFYLHALSSNNPLGSNTNNKIPFFPFIFSKDLFGFSLLGFLGFLEIFFGFISLSHPDNAFEVSVLVTPLHIVPEWYFLEFYAILKAVPNKIAGFMILFSSLFCVFIFGEVKSLSRLILSYSLSFSVIFLVGFCFLWIGAQLPQEKFISSARFFLVFPILILLFFRVGQISYHLCSTPEEAEFRHFVPLISRSRHQFTVCVRSPWPSVIAGFLCFSASSAFVYWFFCLSLPAYAHRHSLRKSLTSRELSTNP